MDASKIAAIALVVAGVLGLAYGGFSYTKETHSTKIGAVELSIKDKEWFNIPVGVGAGAVVLGGVLLVIRRKS